MEVTEISSDEILLRRIPPPPEQSTRELDNGTRRAISFHLRLRDGEVGLSCTRLEITTPQQLLAQLLLQGISVEGWMVCRMFVSDIRAMNLDVVHVPEDDDPGHSEIRGTAKTAYTRKVASRLAKKSRVLTHDEVRAISVGDRIK